MNNESQEITERMIQRFVDGEVTEDQDRAIRLHLRDHPATRLAVQELRGLRKVIAGSAPRTIQPPEGFAERVAREVFADEGATVQEFKRVIPTVKRLALFAAAAGLLLGVSWYWHRKMSEPSAERAVSAGKKMLYDQVNRNPLDELRERLLLKGRTGDSAASGASTSEREAQATGAEATGAEAGETNEERR